MRLSVLSSRWDVPGHKRSATTVNEVFQFQRNTVKQSDVWWEVVIVKTQMTEGKFCQSAECVFNALQLPVTCPAAVRSSEHTPKSVLRDHDVPTKQIKWDRKSDCMGNPLQFPKLNKQSSAQLAVSFCCRACKVGATGSIRKKMMRKTAEAIQCHFHLIRLKTLYELHSSTADGPNYKNKRSVLMKCNYLFCSRVNVTWTHAFSLQTDCYRGIKTTRGLCSLLLETRQERKWNM